MKQADNTTIYGKLRLCGYASYILLVWAACAVPFAGMFLGWGTASTENRSAADMPDLYTATEDRIDPNFSYTEELGEYFSDRFGFRQELVTADAWMNEKLFCRSVNDKTIVGRDGWYFLSETVNDYTGQTPLSERGIYRLKKTLDLMDRYSSEGNITFVFFVAPNKNSIYPEYMPWYIRQSGEPGNLDRLSKAMRGSVYYIDMKDVIRCSAADRSRYVYLKNDSHWNTIGALAAYNAVQDNLNRRIRHYDYLPIDESGLYIAQKDVSGDLTRMLFPALNITDVQYDLGIPRYFSSQKPLDNYMDAEINTTCQGRYYNILCYRDSFFNAFIPINSNAFAKVRYSRTSRESSYDLNAVKSGDYNIALVEIAERNLPDILYSAPIMDAPSVPKPAHSRWRASKQVCELEDNGESLIVSGRLGEWIKPETDSNIYIELRSRSKSYFYEAFPILGGDLYADDGFSLRISKYNVINDDYQLFIHVGDETETVYTELLY